MSVISLHERELFFGKDEKLNCNKIFNTKKILNANFCILQHTIGRVRGIEGLFQNTYCLPNVN